MAEVLFVTWDGGGNVPPAVGLAEELRRRRHAVRFLGHAQQQDVFERSGFTFTASAHARPWSSTAPVDGLSGALTVFRMFADRGPARDLLEQVQRRQPDVVVVDCMSLGCLQAAERAALPRVVLAHTFYGPLSTVYAKGPVGTFARLYGLHPTRLGAVPRVLVSLSTLYVAGQDKVLQNVLDALSGLAAHAVVTTGRGVDPRSLRAPANAEVHQFLPHQEVMPTVDLLVGHGGHATTMRALAHDLPIVVLPLHPAVDQKMIGRSAQRAGVARLLPKTAKPAQIRTAVEALLGDGPHPQACAALGERLREQDGASTAADEVEALMVRGSW